MKKWQSPIVAAAAAALLVNGMGTAGAAEEGTLLAKKSLLEIHTIAGTGEYGFRDGQGTQAAFHEPTSLWYDAANGSYLITDTKNQRIRTLNKDEVADTAAGLQWGADDLSLPNGGFNDGNKDSAVFHHPTGLAEDGQGNFYLADTENHAIRKIDKSGKVTTVAGDGVVGSGDGKTSEARFYHPMDVAVTGSGIIYVADTLNHVIRKIENGNVTTIGAASTRVVEVQEGEYEFAGDYADGPISQARFNEPSGLALDSKGNLYVSDTGNQRIRYIDFAAGTVTTAAGGRTGASVNYTDGFYAEGDYADGAAADARFYAPRGLAVTPEGGVLIADSLNHVIRYLKDGQVTTIAGTANDTGQADGVASAAGFNKPTDVVWIGNDSFAVADSGNNRIRVVEPYAVPAGIKASAAIHLLLNQKELVSDAAPVIVSGTTFVPLRVLTENLGFTVSYSKGKTVLSKGELSYTIVIGSRVVTKTSGQSVSNITLASAAFVKNNRMYVPVRFFAEEAGLDVQWLSDVKAVLVRDKLVP